MLEPPNRSEQPPGCYWYTVPETGKRVPQNGNVGLSQCKAMVAEHYKANGYAVPGNLEETILDFCCHNSVDLRCRERKEVSHNNIGHVQHSDGSRRLTLGDIITGTKTLASTAMHMLKGGDLLTDEQCKARADVCVECLEHQGVGCSACALKQLATSFITQYKDDRLKACTVCGCWLRAKVRVPWEIIARHTSNRTWERYPSHCWMVTEAKAHESEHNAPTTPA